MREQEYVQFCEDLLARITEVAADTAMGIAEVVMMKADKNNDNQTISFVARFEDENSASPAVHAAQFYEEYRNGASVEELANKTVKIFEAGAQEKISFKASDLSRENLDRIYMVVINRDSNPQIANTCANFVVPGTDLMGVVRFKVSDDERGTSSILINREIQTKMFQMTDEELLQLARENTLGQQEFTIKGMNEIIREMVDMPEELAAEIMPPESEQIYVLTNKERINGAIALASRQALHETHEKVGEDFYIIPSSIHEVLCIPRSTIADPAELQRMCKEVNTSNVDIHERLGENIMYCDERLQLHICNSLGELHNVEQGMGEEVSESVSRGIKM